jgi:acyl-CoA thioesterase-1
MKNFKMLAFFRAAAIAAGVVVAAVSGASAEPVSIVAFGDSLTAGYGLGPGESFPEQLEAALRKRGNNVTVANAGVSGDTTSDGLARLEWSIPADADLVIVEFGGNDALRGIDPAITRAALSQILHKLADRGQAVLLAGMKAPRNLGDSYAEAFDGMFPELAAEYRVAFHPFFLEGVATDARLNQADGMHPSAAGVAKIVEAILPKVEAMIASPAASG